MQRIDDRPRRNMATPEMREFWARTEKIAAEVETWPEWKRAGIRIASERSTPRNTGEITMANTCPECACAEPSAEHAKPRTYDMLIEMQKRLGLVHAMLDSLAQSNGLVASGRARLGRSTLEQHVVFTGARITSVRAAYDDAAAFLAGLVEASRAYEAQQGTTSGRVKDIVPDP